MPSIIGKLTWKPLAILLMGPMLGSAGCFYDPSGSVGLDSMNASSSGDSESLPTGVMPPESESTSGESTSGPAMCGNKIVEDGEACDDGNTVDADGCTNVCQYGRCGDGILGAGESCDDGNSEDEDACPNTCVLPVCGDGVIQPPEACDEGVSTAFCNADCTESKCGDGVMNEKANEECDSGGESPACDADCTTAACGDGTVNFAAGEECDESGQTAECNSNCTVSTCGDGELNVESGEECDDGNLQFGDSCSASCVSRRILGLGLVHACAIYGDDVVHCWGAANRGELGYGDEEALGDEPGELPTPGVDVGGKVVQLSLGVEFSCVVLESKATRCWGSGGGGKLGYGNIAGDYGDDPGELPSPDIDLGSDALQIAAGGDHTCAVLVGGTVRCWGRNNHGNLGYGDTQDLYAPGDQDVPGIVGVKELALGNNHSCALLMDGSVRCWGYNYAGQLGLGHTANVGDNQGEVPPPATKVGDPNDAVKQIAAGVDHTCAVLVSGKVRCWGFNVHGETGAKHGETYVGDVPADMPPPDVNLGGPAVRVVAGLEHSCALLEDGAVKCWGPSPANGYPQMNIDNPAAFPPPDVSLGERVNSIESHMGEFTCVQLESGSVRCWGRNHFGELGYGHLKAIGDDEAPSSVTPVPL